MKLSIVATLYQSSPYINEFYQRVSKSAKNLVNEDYEIIFVNDGSPDNSLDSAIQLTKKDNHVLVVDLSRNFGHHKAMRAGLEQAKGDLIFLIDSDLEEEPEWLSCFSKQMTIEDADVIYGVQKERKGGWYERWTGALWYAILNLLLNIDHPKNITTARLMTRRYVSALLRHKEIETVISCLWVITGFKQSSQIIIKNTKKNSSYSFLRKLTHVVNAITSFSIFPLKLIFFCGIIIFLGSLLYTGYILSLHFFVNTVLDGWTSLIVSIWLLGGIIISFIGIIGIYLSKIFLETKQRPYAIIRNIYGNSN